MKKEQEKQFDKLYYDKKLPFPIYSDERKILKQFISTLLKAERDDTKRVVEEIIQRAKTGDMKFDWALDEIIHSIKNNFDEVLKQLKQK